MLIELRQANFYFDLNSSYNADINELLTLCLLEKK